MRNHNERGASGWRSSVLWGTGTRGGDSRSSSLSVKGRGIVAAALAVCALMAAIAGTAAPANAANAGAKASANRGNHPTWIDPKLVSQAKTKPGNKVDVIITSSTGTSGATGAITATGFLAAAEQRLAAIGGIELQIPARFIPFLQRIPGLTVTPNFSVRQSGLLDGLTSGVVGTDSTQVWPFASGNAALWGDDLTQFASSTPAIAVVDSGVSSSDLGSRVIASANVASGSLTAADLDGHGTFVAGMAAGAAAGVAGAAPTAKIVSRDGMDDNGMGRTSDVISACQWILEHKAQYNIKVANFSLHSGVPSNFATDPLDRAVEKLWFSGVTVVAAAGNYGVNGQPVRVAYAPGNDPFVITVGAVDLAGTPGVGNDQGAPFSAYGYTYDGFHKPDLGAPGRYMVGPIPPTSTLALQKPLNVTSPGYIQLSGTSFAAPVVSGTVAQMLARHPGWTPAQVKGALMVTTRSAPNAAPGSIGAGELTASKAAKYAKTPPNPNKALEQFLVPDPAGGPPTFDAAAWRAAVQANASWDAASYADASYADASWDVASYADASYADASYADASYADASYEDAAEGDASASPGAYDLTPEAIQAILADPALAAGAGSLIP
jgi:serine protease AprX